MNSKLRSMAKHNRGTPLARELLTLAEQQEGKDEKKKAPGPLPGAGSADERRCPACDAPAASPSAKYCANCGAELPTDEEEEASRKGLARFNSARARGKITPAQLAANMRALFGARAFTTERNR